MPEDKLTVTSANGEEVEIQRPEPLTQEKLKRMKEEADRRLLELYNAMTNPSGSNDVYKVPEKKA